MDKLWSKCSKAEHKAVAEIEKKISQLNEEYRLHLIDKEVYAIRRKHILAEIDETEKKYA